MTHKKIWSGIGIKTKVIAIIVASVCLAIGITTYINFVFLSRSLTQNSGEKISLIADKTGELIRGEIDNEIKLLSSIALSPRTREEIVRANKNYEDLSFLSQEEKNRRLDEEWTRQAASIEALKRNIEFSSVSQYLRDLQKTNSNEVEIFITDQHGFNVAMTGRTSDYWQADEEWWQKASEGEPYISSPAFDESSKYWAINLAVPVYESLDKGRIIGVVRGTVDITSLLNSVYEIEFGETGRGYFVSTDGNIYHRMEETLEIHPVPQNLINFLKTGETAWKKDLKDLDGIPSITAASEILHKGQTIGWILVLMQEKELQSTILSTMQGNILTAAILIGVLAVIGSLLSNSILRVFHILREEVDQLALGDYSKDFSFPLSASSDPDIHGLVKGFNRMKTAVESRERVIHASEKKYRHLVETMSEGLVMINDKGQISYSNPKLSEITGLSRQEMKGMSLYNFFAPEEKENIALQWVSRIDGLQTAYETFLVKKDGSTLPVLISPQRMTNEREEFAGSLAVITDISIRKEVEIAQRRKINELASLRKIDNAILAKTTLTAFNQIILNQIRDHLNASAASIHIFYPNTTRVKSSRAFIGEKNRSCAKNEISLERIQLHAHQKNFVSFESDIVENVIWKGIEAITPDSLYISPVRNGDDLKGIIEIAFCYQKDQEDDWLSYLNALVTQTAVGIEKIELIEKLETRNKDLQQAYISAIKGWAKALELRDEETKGHSDRVVDMAVNMAREFGFTGEALENFRNGAFLHDIGKMGVPDGILLKPGKLTEEEWQIMKMHPDFAYELLREIPFLKNAYEIPYYHHERWNGTGYPHGLVGEKIPLAARIFAVVDVWDALTSNRPYRPAWSHEETVKYLIDNKGVLFDPIIVDHFLSRELGLDNREDQE